LLSRGFGRHSPSQEILKNWWQFSLKSINIILLIIQQWIYVYVYKTELFLGQAVYSLIETTLLKSYIKMTFLLESHLFKD